MKKNRSLLAWAGLLALSSAHAAFLHEPFTNDPALDGWQTFGDTNLFQWDSTNQILDVTWDSSQTNSYFYHPLGVTLTSTNDFMLAFDFELNDIATGLETNYPQTFQVAIGLLNFAEATSSGFVIGSGYQAPDLVEFDYFPAFDIYSSSVTTPIISSDNNFGSGGFTFPLAIVTGAHYHAVMTYTADNLTLHTTLSSNGVPVGPIQDTTLDAGFGDFHVDTFSINSYSQAGQDTSVYTNSDGSTVIYAGSVLAHGRVGKMSFGTPLPALNVLAAAPGNVQFSGTTNWIFTLERTADFQSWTDVSPPEPGVEGAMDLTDTNPPPDRAFYRVRADLP
jgi:hypothetical protein